MQKDINLELRTMLKNILHLLQIVRLHQRCSKTLIYSFFDQVQVVGRRQNMDILILAFFLTQIFGTLREEIFSDDPNYFFSWEFNFTDHGFFENFAGIYFRGQTFCKDLTKCFCFFLIKNKSGFSDSFWKVKNVVVHRGVTDIKCNGPFDESYTCCKNTASKTKTT